MKLTEENYIERDVSWMLFNRRILAETSTSFIVWYPRKCGRTIAFP